MRWLKPVAALLVSLFALHLLLKLHVGVTGLVASSSHTSQLNTSCKALLFRECNCSDTLHGNATALCESNNKKVVAYSLFGNLKGGIDKYFSLFRDNAAFIEKNMPGWRMRLYYETQDGSLESELCDLKCGFSSSIELRNMRGVRKRLSARTKGSKNRWDPFVPRNEVLGLNKRLWRYLALLDTTVDIAIMRDFDARITQRELAALRQWLESEYTFHVMRDHQEHRATIMAGLFGAKLNKKRELIQGLTLGLISSAQNQKYDTDQRLLHRIFWPSVKQDVMAHDSFYCKEKFNYLQTYPFPTKRVNSSFVSDNPSRDWVSPSECPAQCRPKDHNDWLYC